MNSPSSKHADAGYSLLEMLVVLAILATAIGLGASALRGSSEPRILQSIAERIVAEAKSKRLQAMIEERAVSYVPDAGPGSTVTACENGSAALLFLPDGGLRGGDLCVSRGTHKIRVHADWLTGLLRVTASDQGIAQ